MIVPDLANPAGASIKVAREGAGGRHGESGDGAAWLREMERQQMQAWLSHGLLPVAAAPGPVYARIDPAPAQEQQAAAPGVGRPAGDGEGKERGDAVARPDGSVSPAGEADSDPVRDRAVSATAMAAAAHTATADMAGLPAGRPEPMPEQGLGPAAGTPRPELGAPVAQAIVDAVTAQRGPAIAQPRTDASARVAVGPAGTPVRIDGAPRQPVPDLAHAAAAHTGTVPARQTESGERRQAQAQGRTAQARPAAQLDAPEPLPALRIHSAWSDGVVRVWIGADQGAGLTGLQLMAAAQDVRRLLREQGAVLGSFTYNGTMVLDEDGRTGVLQATPGQDGSVGYGDARAHAAVRP